MAILTVITSNGMIDLPAPVTISVGNQIIWASNTGRSGTGKMLGDVIAEKDTLDIKWGYLKAAEFNIIKTSLRAGFFSLQVNIDGTPIVLPHYRGTITSEPLGQLGDGIYYFKSAGCSVVEQ